MKEIRKSPYKFRSLSYLIALLAWIGGSQKCNVKKANQYCDSSFTNLYKAEVLVNLETGKKMQVTLTLNLTLNLKFISL